MIAQKIVLSLGLFFHEFLQVQNDKYIILSLTHNMCPMTVLLLVRFEKKLSTASIPVKERRLVLVVLVSGELLRCNLFVLSFPLLQEGNNEMK